MLGAASARTSASGRPSRSELPATGATSCPREHSSRAIAGLSISSTRSFTPQGGLPGQEGSVRLGGRLLIGLDLLVDLVGI